VVTNTPTNTPTATPTLSCQPKVQTPDFSKVAVGSSVEGLGVVAPDLNINAQGTALKLLAGTNPFAYLGNSGGSGGVKNGGMAPGGGFSDISARLNAKAHHYTFTFTPGLTISNFSVHMLDYGDLNPSLSPTHFVKIAAYDANGVLVSQRGLSYTTPPDKYPASSNLYGDLRITGDAMTASSGQPGNWTWRVTGHAIVKVKLDFGVGYDPNIALDVLSFIPECP
jgi:hypothetical protein